MARLSSRKFLMALVAAACSSPTRASDSTSCYPFMRQLSVGNVAPPSHPGRTGTSAPTLLDPQKAQIDNGRSTGYDSAIPIR